jgi:hypothetical protein
MAGRGRSRVAAWGAASSIFAAVAAARAETPFELDWVAPQECPNAAQVRAVVPRYLRHPPPQDAALSVRADVRRDESGIWHATLRTRWGEVEGERALEAESCRALADSTALIIALILDPEALETPEAATGVEPPAPRPGPARPTPPPRREPRARPVPRGLELRGIVGPVLSFDTGLLPAPSYGVGAHAGALARGVSLELGVVTWRSQKATLSGVPVGAGSTIGLLSSFAAVCFSLGGRFTLGACATGELGRYDARGTGALRPYSPGTRHSAVGGLMLARAFLRSWFSLSVSAGALSPLDRPTFVIDGLPREGKLHQPAKFTGRGTLSVDLAIGP